MHEKVCFSAKHFLNSSSSENYCKVASKILQIDCLHEMPLPFLKCRLLSENHLPDTQEVKYRKETETSLSTFCTQSENQNYSYTVLSLIVTILNINFYRFIIFIGIKEVILLNKIFQLKQLFLFNRQIGFCSQFVSFSKKYETRDYQVQFQVQNSFFTRYVWGKSPWGYVISKKNDISYNNTLFKKNTSKS